MPKRCLVFGSELLLVSLFLVSFVNGFLLQKKNLLRRPSFLASNMVNTETTTIPNWRILNADDDPATLLSQREHWSERCYQEALQLYENLTHNTDSYVAGQMEAALNCLDHAYRLYGPESVICSFNGGKDAVVILHLIRAAHAHYYYQQQQQNNNIKPPIRPRVVYFDHRDEFPQVIDFLQTSVQEFDLDMICFPKGTSFSQGLQILVDNNIPHEMDEMNFPMSFVLGTRTTDPNAGKQGAFAPSSHYMPPFMRVNPILEWTYGHVWHFLRLFQLRYCCLYDQGYTSLGTTKDTLPCPALAVVGGNRTIPKYWPAYMLRDWDQERAGRISKEKKNDESSESTLQQSQLLRANSSMVPSSDGSDKDATFESLKPLEDTSCVSYSSNSTTQRTVGLLIIGDEILKGFTADTNTQAAAVALRNQNVLLERVVIVSDNQDEIAEEIRRLQSEVDVIITSGGVGPTHDDVTIKSVAVALECDMVLHEEMARLLRDKMNSGENVDLTEAQTKMATLPSTSKLRYLSDNPKDWPVLQCQNIFILPGVPEFFEKKIENVAAYLSCQLERSVAYKVVLSVDEHSIVTTLNRVVENHPNVSFGSYPFVSHPDYKTVITVEARLLTGGRSNSVVFDRNMIDMPKKQMDRHVQLALDELITTLPDGSVLRVDNDDMALFS